jgi:hypothetical protein
MKTLANKKPKIKIIEICLRSGDFFLGMESILAMLSFAAVCR